MALDDRGQFLLVEEYFSTGDARFLDALRLAGNPKQLAPFATRWAGDFRPWAREQLLSYLDAPLDRPGHQPLVKRLFKGAEAQKDDELMGAFAVAFDRLVRRVRRTRYHYEYRSRTSWQEEYLYAPRNGLPGGPVEPGRIGQNPRTLQRVYVPLRYPRNARLFSYHTRYYLRRRAWRYFRRMAHQRPGDYAARVARWLNRFRDEDFQRGENVLDSWSLLHACFFDSAVFDFTASKAQLRDGRGLDELKPAPYLPDLWRRPEAARVLLDLIVRAQARLVRVWAIGMLRTYGAEHLAGITPLELLPLLESADDETQQLGAELLERASGLETLPVTDWLRLLRTRSITALETICRVMALHVHAGRLTLFDAVNLTIAEPTPVARMGLDFVKARTIASPTDRQGISNLARAECAGMGKAITTWALGILGKPEFYNIEQVIRFFDGLLREVRDAAWEWLTEASAGWNDPVLWARLLETPYEDIRLRLVETLARRSKLPGASASDLAPLWSSVLLGVHRGGRHKLTALRQISDALHADAASAEKLLPVLAVAIRSVRLPEARAGLAAIVSAVEASPAVEPLVARYLPELELRARSAPMGQGVLP
jgi:hypothetical protein